MIPERARENAVRLGWRYLESEHQNGYFPSSLSASREMAQSKLSPRENFSTIMIADTILAENPDSEITRAALQHLEEQRQQRQFTFFIDRTRYPPDTDTNALGYSVLLEAQRVPEQDAHQMLDTILNNRNKDELIQVYLSTERPNLADHVVSANALHLAYLLGRENETVSTENWLLQTLNSGAYLNGSRYYHSPDLFLYFMGRLTKFPALSEKIKSPLTEHLQQRIGKTEYPLDLAMRTFLADRLMVENKAEKQKVLQIQEQDGSWPADGLFRYGSRPGYFGSRALTTAFSMKALKSV